MTKEKMAKHTSKEKVEGQRMEAQALSEEATPSENTKHSKRKYRPNCDVERNKGRQGEQHQYHTHYSKVRWEEKNAEHISRQKGAGRRTAAQAKRETAAPGEKKTSSTAWGEKTSTKAAQQEDLYSTIARQQKEGLRAKNRRASRARRSGAQRKD